MYGFSFYKGDTAIKTFGRTDEDFLKTMVVILEVGETVIGISGTQKLNYGAYWANF